jgi:hypothetical protein
LVPSQLVKSDSPVVRRVLTEIAAIACREGATVHPGARLVETRGNLSVHFERPGGESSRNLFEIPRELLIPLDNLNWSDRTDRFVLSGAPGGLTMVQERLLALHIELYNATHKLAWWVNEHPRRLLLDDGPVRQAVHELRPGLELPAEEMPAAGFLETRAYWTRAGDGRYTPVLMPLIDLLNHHHRGAPLELDGFAMRAAVSQPASGTECFGHYGGRRDVLGLALYLGHLDRATPFAHSGPMRFRSPELGEVALLAEGRQPAHPTDPPEVVVKEDGIKISHLCCNLEHPGRARAVLRLALVRAARLRGLGMQEAEAAGQRTIADIAAGNRERLVRLASACGSAVSTRPAAKTLMLAARRQAHIIQAVIGGEVTERETVHSP